MLDGDWSGQSVVCDGTTASEYIPGTFQIFVDAGFGTFVQTFQQLNNCQLIAPGPVSCFYDGGGSFVQMTFTPSVPATCVPQYCGLTAQQAPFCGATGSPINWALTNDTSTGFTSTSVDPNSLGTCTSLSLMNPIVINWTLE